MKLILFVLFIPILSFANDEAPMPSWAKRHNQVLRGEKVKSVPVTWYLGFAESRNLNEAKQKAEFDSQQTIAKQTSKSNNFYSKKLKREDLRDSAFHQKSFSHTDIVPIKIHDMRVYHKKQDGLWLVYFDIAVKDSYLATINEKTKAVPFHEAFDYSEQNVEITDVNQDFEDRLTFLDDHHMIIYRVFSHERLNTFSLGYEYSFSKKRYGIEAYFILKVDQDDANDGVYNQTYETFNKSAIDFNIGLYKKYNRVLNLSIGYVENKDETGRERYNGDEEITSTNKRTGYSVGLKYRYAFDGSWRSGFLVEAKSEFLSGKKDNVDIDNESYFESAFGIFISF